MNLQNYKIIAIGGLKNSGKDTAAKMLQYLLNFPKFLRTYKCYTIFKTFSNWGKFKLTSFAHPLKRTLSALLNIPIKKFEDRKFKEETYIYFPTMDITTAPNTSQIVSANKFTKQISAKDLSFLKSNYITIRQLLQVFGTNVMREIFDDNIWINLTTRDSFYNNLIISDLRFNVEYEAIKNLKGCFIYIERPNCEVGNHASEQEVYKLAQDNKFDIKIQNTGSLESLFNAIKQYV